MPPGFARSEAIFATVRSVETPSEAGRCSWSRSPLWISRAASRAGSGPSTSTRTAASSMLRGTTRSPRDARKSRISWAARSYFVKSAGTQTASGHARSARRAGTALRTPNFRAS